MCGIGLHAVLTNSTDNCTHCDTQQDIIIRTCIANAIEPRGPDVPHSHLHRPSNAESAWDVYMCASVLHMRGPVPTVQPYCLTQNDHHFAFLWNGECYSMTSNPSSSSDAFYDTASVHEPWHSHSNMQLPLQDGVQVQDSSSDTQLVLQSLLQSAFSIDASHATQDTLVKLAHTMSTIQGEYAFALWAHPITKTKEDQGSIYFARDPLGRRSLLMHTVPVSASSSSSMDTIETISSLILSSVALTDFFIHGQEAVSIQGDSAKTIVHPLQEVIPGRVYHFDLSKKRLSFVTIPSTSTPIPLSSPPLSPPTFLLDSKIQPSHPSTSSGSSSFLDPSHDISSSPTLQAAEHLLTLLHAAVRRRVVDLSSYPNPSTTHTAKVALLFSGGLDSVVLAALSHFHIPLDQSIDLINVSFASSSTTTLTPSTTDGEHPLKPSLDMKNKIPTSGFQILTVTFCNKIRSMHST